MQTSEQSKYNFSAGTIEKIGNIMKITYTKQTPVTLQDQKEITKIREKLFGDNKYCTLVDLSEDKLVLTPDAKKYVTENKTIKKLRVAEVLLVKSFGQKIGVHTYVRIARWKDNVTVMTSKEEDNAIHWLKRQYKKHVENANEIEPQAVK